MVTPKKEHILELYAEGLGYSDIARLVGCSKQYVNQLVMPEKDRARRRLNQALVKGNIIKADTCTYCRQPKDVEGHHKDYAAPLDVIWLCSDCHAFEHVTEKVYRGLMPLYRANRKQLKILGISVKQLEDLA